MKKNKLLFILTDSYSRYLEFKILASKLENLDYEISVAVSRKLYKLAEKIDYKTYIVSANGLINDDYKSKLIFKVLKKLAWRTSLGQILFGLIKYYHLYKLYKKSRKVLDLIKPDIAFTIGDREQGLIQPFLKSLDEKKIKVVFPYFAVSVHNLSRRAKDKNYVLDNKSTLIEKIIFNKYRSQSLVSNDKKVYFYNAQDFIAFKLLGTLSNYAWWRGSRYGDAICVSSQLDKNNFIKNGRVKDLNKILIVGDMNMSQLYESLTNKEKIKKNIVKKNNFDSKEKLIIISLPNYFEHADLTSEDSLNEINFLINTVSINFKNVLVSLHPSMKNSEKKNDYIDICRKYNVNILDDSLAEVLPICDLFIATNSTTIYWSVILGIKSISMCFNDMDDTHISQLKSPKIVYNHDSFKLAINTIFNSEVSFSSDWKLLSKEKTFNSDFHKRYNNIIQKLLTK